MKSIKLLTTLLIICSGCAAVERPDTNIYVVNAPKLQMKGYNLRTDYNESGELIPGAVAKVVPLTSLDDLNKHVCTDIDGWINLKVYIKQLREAAVKP